MEEQSITKNVFHCFVFQNFSISFPKFSGSDQVKSFQKLGSTNIKKMENGGRIVEGIQSIIRELGKKYDDN